MTGVDWRQRFTDYKAALANHQRAEGCVDQLRTRLAVCATDSERTAIEVGMTLAERRAHLTSQRLATATEAFAQGRSVLEAVWAAPDDI